MSNDKKDFTDPEILRTKLVTLVIDEDGIGDVCPLLSLKLQRDELSECLYYKCMFYNEEDSGCNLGTSCRKGD